MAVASPLLETSIAGAKRVLINITGAMDLGLDDVESAAGIVMEAAHPDANIIFGAAFDETFEDEMVVTVIAAGFDDMEQNKQAAVRPGVFSTAAAQAQQAAAAAPTAPAEDVSDIDEIFKIFNRD